MRAEAPEQALVVRTAWLYGAHGPCFPKTIARAAHERGALQVVEDQVGQPTWTRDLAELMVRLVAADAPAGTWHATSGGQASWFEFARAIVETAGLSPEIVSPTDSTAFQRPAPRPAYSVLGHQRWSGPASRRSATGVSDGPSPGGQWWRWTRSTRYSPYPDLRSGSARSSSSSSESQPWRQATSSGEPTLSPCLLSMVRM